MNYATVHETHVEIELEKIVTLSIRNLKELEPFLPEIKEAMAKGDFYFSSSMDFPAEDTSSHEVLEVVAAMNEMGA